MDGLVYILNRSSNYRVNVELLNCKFGKSCFLSYAYDRDLLCEIYASGRLVSSISYRQISYRGILFPFAVIYNSFVILRCVLHFKKCHHAENLLCIVENWLHCPVAVLLRISRIVRPLVYWAGDWLYLPVRPFFAYANIRSNIQSLLFLLFDAVTCKLSDRVWDTTERISRARKGICPWVLKSGKERTLSPLFIHRSCRINRTPDCFHFVHFGVLTEDRQPSLLLRAISQIIHLGHRVHLHLIGFSIDRNEDMLSNLGATLGITEHVTFHGFIEEFDQIDSMLQQYDCGLALAVPSCHLHSYFAWTSKIAYYLSMGVPVVTTRHSSELAVWIEKYHAGCVVDNSLESLVDAMLQVMESYRTGFPRIVDQNINLLIDAVDSVNSFNEVLMDLARTNAFSGGESR